MDELIKRIEKLEYEIKKSKNKRINIYRKEYVDFGDYEELSEESQLADNLEWKRYNILAGYRRDINDILCKFDLYDSNIHKIN